MARYAYERLSPQDNDFLIWECPGLPMHVGGVQTFRAGPLATPGGGIDFESIKRLTESVLHRIPRYRQKLMWIPGEEHAVWIDDPHFNLDYHVRHTALPRPGSDEQLKRLASRIMEHPLDRERPLWETWVVEGLEGDRFATINKIHHCTIDGSSGVDLSQILLSLSPEREIRPPQRFIPRATPRRSELQNDERLRRLTAPLRAARDLFQFARKSPDLAGEITQRARALQELAHWKWVPASQTPLNGNVGLHRAVEWFSLPLDDIKAIRHKLDCSVNDVVLTIVTGAIRQFMMRRQVDPDVLDFRVSAPVNVRPAGEQNQMTNHVSSWIIRLPIDRDDPREQIDAIHQTTSALKASNQAIGVEMVTALLDWLPIDMQSAATGTVNTIVTNIPGPPFPLFLLGAELLEVIPLPPLMRDVGLVIGALSYNGKVCWGFNADYDRVGNLSEFVEDTNRAFRRLAEVAGVERTAPALRPEPQRGRLSA